MKEKVRKEYLKKKKKKKIRKLLEIKLCNINLMKGIIIDVVFLWDTSDPS